MAVPNLDNKPRYETPDSCQLLTPKDIPRVQLPVITEKRNTAEQRELEQQEREAEARAREEDSDDDDRINKFAQISLEEWMKVGWFLLQHTIGFLNITDYKADIDIVSKILEEGKEKKQLADTFNETLDELEIYRGQENEDEDRLEEIAGLKKEVQGLLHKLGASNLNKDLSIRRQEIEMKEQEEAYRKTIEKLEKEVQELRLQKVERDEKIGDQLQICERDWKEWAEKEVEERTKKILVSQQKKWQAKGKALLVETVSVATQSDQVPVVVEAEKILTEEEIEKRGAKDREDVVMADRSDLYEDLSGYEDEDEAPVVAPPTTKKQAATRSAVRAGKNSRLVKLPPPTILPGDNRSKAIVIHGVPCQRPMADITEEIGMRGIMGARWLLGGNRRLGKATSSVVVFFDRKLAVGSHLKLRGRWLPIEAYDFERGRKRVDLHGDR
ncbi:hypothetical protein EV426DRAFT_586136 [Tirmania nivea]|nr:hypothetical protein EV426DRAFT_586136 [Tirmania nivea]